MNKILDIIKNKRYDYSAYPFRFIEECDVAVIIPARGRREFLPPVLKSLRDADTNGLRIKILVVEHSSYKELESYGDYYDHIPTLEGTFFNKCLCMNIGAISAKNARYLLFHDSDLLVKKDFISNIFANIKNKNARAIQTFGGRKVLYCDKQLTQEMISLSLDARYLSPQARGVYDKNKPSAPGGSIMVERSLFFSVGGFDPELWHSYSQEDMFFWDKISMVDTMHTCDSPRNEVYHMDHPLQQFNNPDFNKMLALYKSWAVLPPRDKLKIIEYKHKIFKDYE